MFKKFLSVFFVGSAFAGARVCALDIKPIIIPVGREVTLTIRATNAEEKKLLAETPV